MAAHLAADVANSLGIVAGLLLAVLTGRAWLDPVLAAASAVYILVSGLFVVRDSVGGLMDAAPSPEVVERIRTLVGAHAEGAIEAHDLRARHAGRLTFLEFHLVVPGSMTVAASHEICDRIEAALKAEMEGLSVSIHVEPTARPSITAWWCYRRTWTKARAGVTVRTGVGGPQGLKRERVTPQARRSPKRRRGCPRNCRRRARPPTCHCPSDPG